MTALEQQLQNELQEVEELNIMLIKRLETQEIEYLKNLQKITTSNKLSNQNIATHLEKLEKDLEKLETKL